MWDTGRGTVRAPRTTARTEASRRGRRDPAVAPLARCALVACWSTVELVALAAAGPARGAHAAATVVAALALAASGICAALVLGRMARSRRSSRFEHLGPLLSERHDQEVLHETRSTVAGIAAASRLLSEPATLDAATHERVRWMRDREIARLERLLAAPAAPRIPVLHPDGADATDLDLDLDLDAVIEPLVVSRRVRGEDVRWRPCGLRVRGWPDHVAEVANVLLDNAARHAPGAAVEVSVDHTGDEVRLRVSDRGRGVDRAIRPHVFAWGRRGPASPGRGIGLAAARSRALGMGGRLELADSAGSGAAFELYLQRAGGPSWVDRRT